MTAQKMSVHEIIAFIGNAEKKTNVKVTFEGELATAVPESVTKLGSSFTFLELSLDEVSSTFGILQSFWPFCIPSFRIFDTINSTFIVQTNIFWICTIFTKDISTVTRKKSVSVVEVCPVS